MTYRSAAFINGTVTRRPTAVGVPTFPTASCSETCAFPQLLRNLNERSAQEKVPCDCQNSGGFWYQPHHQC
jgi:hypothetical protein